MSRKVSKSSSHGGGVKGQNVPYVAGFHLPSPEEVVDACGCFPWTGDTFKSKHREDILLGKGGGGKTTRESIQHLDIPHYYQQDRADKQFWCDLPAPADDSSWLAQVNEPGQTFDEYVQFITLRSGKFKPNSNSENANIYLLPLSEEEGSWPQSGPALDGIIEYVSAFFCREVVQLDYVHLRPNPGRPARKSVVWKTGTHECEIAGRISANDTTPRFQCHVDGLLTEIAAVRDDGSYNGQEISNAFALIGITMSDLFSGDTDLFIAGMAAGGSKVAVLSLARYHPHVKMCPFHWDDFSFMPSASAYSYHEDNKKRKAAGATSAPLFDSLSQKSKGEYIRRAGKLIVHEICHVYGIDHCIHYHCLMNGTGHLVEDFTAPAYLCPVCLRKLQFRLGFDVLARYEGLLAVFQKWDLTPEARWIRDRLQALRSPAPEGSLGEGAVEAKYTESNSSGTGGKSSLQRIGPRTRASSKTPTRSSSRKRKGRDMEKSENRDEVVVDLTEEEECQ